MIKIDVVSGFLGAGKTTLIKKLLKEALSNTKVVLIENEFGEIGIDGGFLKDAGIEIKEMNSGCICCSLVGDFGASLKEVMETYTPDRILIEPSGVGKLSDVMKAVRDVTEAGRAELNSAVAVVDATKCKMYIKNFGEFFIDQISHAGTIILSRTEKVSEEKLTKCVEMLREYNARATVVTTPWDQLDGQAIMDTIEKEQDWEQMILEEVQQEHTQHNHEHSHEEHDEACTCGCDHEHHHEHHGHEEHGQECTCGCHDHGNHHEQHDHEEHGQDCTCGCHEQGHHHEEHGQDCTCGCHEQGHHHEHHNHEEHGENCACGCHDHEHHHADEVFTSFGLETPVAYEKEDLERILEQLEDESKYGYVLRAKGMVASGGGGWIYFDYVPGESNIRNGKADVTGKICVIGSQLKEDNLKELWKKEGRA